MLGSFNRELARRVSHPWPGRGAVPWESLDPGVALTPFTRITPSGCATRLRGGRGEAGQRVLDRFRKARFFVPFSLPISLRMLFPTIPRSGNDRFPGCRAPLTLIWAPGNPKLRLERESVAESSPELRKRSFDPWFKEPDSKPSGISVHYGTTIGLTNNFGEKKIAHRVGPCLPSVAG